MVEGHHTSNCCLAFVVYTLMASPLPGVSDKLALVCRPPETD
jgi:hypothetical protein